MSSQAVLSKDLEPILRNAVIRAISCEVSCKREGPIVFSDPSVSTVFANNFFLKDSKARGFQRYYSIVVLTKTREHLIANLDMVESSVETCNILEDRGVYLSIGTPTLLSCSTTQP